YRITHQYVYGVVRTNYQLVNGTATVYYGNSCRCFGGMGVDGSDFKCGDRSHAFIRRVSSWSCGCWLFSTSDWLCCLQCSWCLTWQAVRSRLGRIAGAMTGWSP